MIFLLGVVLHYSGSAPVATLLSYSVCWVLFSYGPVLNVGIYMICCINRPVTCVLSVFEVSLRVYESRYLCRPFS